MAQTRKKYVRVVKDTEVYITILGNNAIGESEYKTSVKVGDTYELLGTGSRRQTLTDCLIKLTDITVAKIRKDCVKVFTDWD